MKLIEQEMLYAIKNYKKWKKNNTKVIINETIIDIFLYDNLICRFDFVNKTVYLDDKNYRTLTTKSRLNALCSYFKLPTIYQKKRIWYIGKDKWLGTYYTTLN